jgi:hypothetical protein
VGSPSTQFKSGTIQLTLGRPKYAFRVGVRVGVRVGREQEELPETQFKSGIYNTLG